MTNKYLKITLEDFTFFLDRFPFERQISSVHLHQTHRPRKAMFRQRETIVEMARQHREGYGFGDIAQHLTIAPDGSIWLGRNWNHPPASLAGHNGNQDNGPFMIALVGDFTLGNDQLEGKQSESLCEVIALLQDRFQLSPESLQMQGDLAPNSSNLGHNIQRKELLKKVRETRGEVRKERKAIDAARPFSDEALELNRTLNTFVSQTMEHADPINAELKGDIQGSRDFYLYSDSAPASTATGQRGWFDRLNDQQIDEIRPHVISLTQGRFSSDGALRSDETDVDAIFDDYLPRKLQDFKKLPKDRSRQHSEGDGKFNIVFYAHGGLVSERIALLQAYHDIPWWNANNVYPIYFIWEIGLIETIIQLIQHAFQRVERSGTRAVLPDFVVEKLARTLRGDILWSGMKGSAQAASEATGGAYYLAKKLVEFCQKYGEDVNLHAVGHSAGAIFHSHFLPLVRQLDVQSFKTVHFLAPAITVADFKVRLKPLLNQQGIDHLTLFTLRKELEFKDKIAFVYGKSILYLIHKSLEPKVDEPILGLEISLRGDPVLKDDFGLRGTVSEYAEVIWATTRNEHEGLSASQATTHSSFNDDRPTMNSVLRRVLRKDDNDPISDFPPRANRGLNSWGDQFELPPEIAEWAVAHQSAPTFNLIANGAGVYPARVLPAAFGSGRRRALCVGINQYPVRPLRGCVHDSELWASTLMNLGFEAPIMLRDGEATRAAIINALNELVTTSTPGDVIVLQYAGHGAKLPDLNDDEAGEDTSSTDEALCPIDFMSGAFIIDDDLAEIFARTPDGVNVTCFFDCCHSGTVTRLAVGATGRSRDGMLDERPRWIPVTQTMLDAHAHYRRASDVGRSLTVRGAQTMREVVFSACRSDELAWETDGKGDFTVRATEILRNGTMTNQTFYDRVVAAFGSTPRQHPTLDSAPNASGRMLLQPIHVSSATHNPPLLNSVNGERRSLQLLRLALSALEQGV